MCQQTNLTQIPENSYRGGSSQEGVGGCSNTKYYLGEETVLVLLWRKIIGVGGVTLSAATLSGGKEKKLSLCHL